MKKNVFLWVWIILILLTMSTALISNSVLSISISALLILGLSSLKFIGVSFYFMELRKAHALWKVSLIVYVLIFMVITMLFI
ncbi:cytochrome C oxidase subunit IV family protein [uncultured Lutibacter sp.]|uniref:cytochrome C oxidase subunit IV family protein n=1 Tax=uncultured Lutibacter sp. TaxID=437739 RepID=UPI00262AFCFA|nr:cytochrome C oxidase subunit IV family protein [uncultured Lutibacter sp.]